MSDYYNRISSLCEMRGITIGKMCTELRIRQSVLSDLKAGRTKTLSADNLSKISAYFDVSVDYLLGTSTVIETSSNAQPDLIVKYNQLTPEGQKEVLAFIEFKQAQESAIAARGGKVVKKPSPASAETLDKLSKATEDAAKKENDQF